MIIALLLLIVLILLFGAAAVKGWLTNIFSVGCGFIAIVGVMLWIGSFFGENGFAYVMFGLLGLLLVAGLIAKAYENR